MFRLFPFLLLLTACGHTMGQRGHDLGDNAQTRAAFDLMVVRDCEMAAYTSGDDKTLEAYLRDELDAMKAYQDSGAIVLVRPFPIEVEIAAAYARLAMLEQERGNEAEALALQEQALAAGRHDHDGVQFHEWRELEAFIHDVDEQRQAAIEARNGVLAVPLHCVEEDWEAPPG